MNRRLYRPLALLAPLVAKYAHYRESPPAGPVSAP